MNKYSVEKMLPRAYQVLKDTGIAKDGKILKSYRSQISSFGAAVNTGSLLAAIAFFSVNAKSKNKTEDKISANAQTNENEEDKENVKRSKLMNAIFQLLNPDTEAKTLFAYVIENKDKTEKMTEDIINAAIALKLAMNLFELVKEK